MGGWMRRAWRRARLALSPRLAWEALKAFDAHEGWVMSGYIAYSLLLAIFPFLIFVAALASVTVGPERMQAVIDFGFAHLPGEVARAIEPVAREVLGRDRGGLLTVSGLGALWVASNGFEAFRTAFDRAYGCVEERGFLARRLISLAMVLIMAAALGLLAFVLVLAPLMARLADAAAELGAPDVEALASLAGLNDLIAPAALAAALWLMHVVLPWRPRRGRPLWPGVAVTLALWWAGARLFSLFLAEAPSYTLTYGSLAGVIVTLLFFYAAGAATIYGAEWNAAAQRAREAAEGKTEGPGR